MLNKSDCRERAKEMAFKILPANATVLDLNYAISQLTPLYEMIDEAEHERPGERIIEATRELVSR